MNSAVSVTSKAVSASAGGDVSGDMGGMIVLNETIHQQTRLRIMTLLVSVPESDRLAYGFIQQTLGLTGGNLTIHLRKLQDAGYLSITKEFVGSKPRTWAQALDFRPGNQ